MTEAEHAELVCGEREGRLLIGIDRAVARRFYTDVSISSVEEQTGERPYLEKIVVLACFVGSPFSLLASFVLSGLYFHWWSFVIIPVLLVFWVLYYASSSHPGARLGGATLILAVVTGNLFFLPWNLPGLWFYFFAALSLWLGRCVYVAATRFLRDFVLRNHRAFNLLAGSISIRIV